MELTDTHTLPVSQQQTWDALNDTEVLRACIPGCESIEPEGENTYRVALSAAVGPVKARFQGRMQLADINAPNSYSIVFEGQGGAAGFAKGNARVTLEADGENATKLSYTASAQIGGKLAQIGSRLVDGAARKIAGEFFKRFGAKVAGENGEPDAAAESTAAADTSAQRTAPDDDTGPHTDPTERKKSWTAWISKS